MTWTGSGEWSSGDRAVSLPFRAVCPLSKTRKMSYAYSMGMKRANLELIIASRLEDMADRVEFHHHRGNHSEANLLRREGLELAQAYDDSQTFLFTTDLKKSR